jgi:Protein of unknown function (DUF2584)
MGMPCEINSIVKLNLAAFPVDLTIGAIHTASKSGYRIFPIDVPLQLVDEQWQAQADVVIQQLIWENQTTTIVLRIHRVYAQPFLVK